MSNNYPRTTRNNNTNSSYDIAVYEYTLKIDRSANLNPGRNRTFAKGDIVFYNPHPENPMSDISKAQVQGYTKDDKVKIKFMEQNNYKKYSNHPIGGTRRRKYRRTVRRTVRR